MSKSRANYKLVILDRDGVLNIRNRQGYILSKSQLHLPPDIRSLERLPAAGIRVALATNQQCIGLKLITLDSCRKLSMDIFSGLALKDIQIFICPHLPDESCGCRKPMPGLLTQALLENDLKVGDAVMVGDSTSDLNAATSLGMDFIGVCWDSDCLGSTCSHTLTAAVTRILNLGETEGEK